LLFHLPSSPCDQCNNPKNIVGGNNKFAFQLYNELKGGTDKNLFYSPLSISTALAMGYAGARSETAQQISRTMNFQPDEDFMVTPPQ